jgi:hypothetical protein
LTPGEQALQAFQTAQTQASLQAALASASTPEEGKAAQDAITQDRLQTEATAERTAADKAYADAVKQLQDERTAEEEKLTAALDKLLERVLNGTGSIGDLADIAAKYGVTIGKDLIPDMASLSSATSDLAKAFADLVAFIRKVTGQSPGATPRLGTGGGGMGAGWGYGKGPQLAALGGIVRARPGGTLVRVGEARRDEMIVPLGRGGGVAPTVNIYVQHLIGTERQSARALAKLVEPELARMVGFSR